MLYRIEGKWSGYTPPQQRICHREYVDDNAFANRITALGCVHFTDGTRMDLNVIPQHPWGKRDPVIDNGYGKLMRACLKYGTNDVATLQNKQREASHGVSP